MTTERRENSRINQGTKVPLAPNQAESHTYIMNQLTFPQLDMAFRDIAKAREQSQSQPSVNPFRAVVNQFKLIRAWIAMRRVAKTTEAQTFKIQKAWRDMVQATARSGQFYPVSNKAYDELRSNAADIKSFLDLEANAESLSLIFPREVKRIREASQRARQIYTYFAIEVRKEDPIAISDAERQYHAGELLDLETFVNGLQGVR